MESNEESFESQHSQHASAEREVHAESSTPLSRKPSFHEGANVSCGAGDIDATLTSSLDQQACADSENQASMLMSDKPEDSAYTDDVLVQQTQSQSSPALSQRMSFEEAVCGTAVCGTAESGSTSTTQSPRAEHDAYDEFEDDYASDHCSSDEDFEDENGSDPGSI
jgi:hypothetical protein